MGPRQLQLIAALRSGKYRQRTGRLYWNGCFCAEGVACDISGLGKWTDVGYLLNDVWTHRAPQQVLDYFGLMPAGIWQLNDNHELSFDGIADALEADPHFYFNRSI